MSEHLKLHVGRIPRINWESSASADHKNPLHTTIVPTIDTILKIVESSKSQPMDLNQPCIGAQ